MKILIATHCRDIVGGIETYLQALIPRLLEHGHEVRLVYDYFSGNRATAIDSFEAGLPAWRCQDLRENPALWQELVAWRPEVVYSNGLASVDMDRTLQQQYPAVMYLHAYWGVCTTGRKSHAFPQIQPCTRTFGPMCLLLHYPRRCGGLNPLLAWEMFQKESQRNALLAGYKAVLVASNHMYSEYQRHGIGPDKLRLVRYPLTKPVSSLAPQPKSPGDSFCLWAD